jgi:hypothetical protein
MVLKLVCNVNMVYGNLKSENTPDYAHKPQQNGTFMNLASEPKSLFTKKASRGFRSWFYYDNLIEKITSPLGIFFTA